MAINGIGRPKKGQKVRKKRTVRKTTIELKELDHLQKNQYTKVTIETLMTELEYRMNRIKQRLKELRF